MKKILFFFILGMSTAFADVAVPMYATSVTGKGVFLGNVNIQEIPYGLLFVPQLRNFTPGLHGFHIHDMADCEESGMAAGGHLDPQHTGKHSGPYRDDGHLGDLPVLYADVDGQIVVPVLAPRVKLADIGGHALMIHAGGDNYSDYPRELGGGGLRVACGLIPK